MHKNESVYVPLPNCFMILKRLKDFLFNMKLGLCVITFSLFFIGRGGINYFYYRIFSGDQGLLGGDTALFFQNILGCEI